MVKRQRSVQLKVPEGAEPGDSLTCVIQGTEMDIAIPHGTKVGDILQIQLGFDEDNGEDRGEDDSAGTMTNGSSSSVTKVKLHDCIGFSLDIHSCLPEAEVQEKEGDKDGDDNDNSDNKKDDSDGTHAMPWPAGIHMVKEMTSPSLSDIIRGKRNIVELGSGSGVVGLAVAALIAFQRSERKTKKVKAETTNSDVMDSKKKITVTLTDFPSSLPLLKHNIAVNHDKLSSFNNRKEVNVCEKALIWGIHGENLESINNKDNGNIDLILGSDLLYNAKPETYKALCSTIEELDTSKISDIILSVRWRKPEEERAFFQQMESIGYKSKLLTGSEDMCNLGWKDFGNPKCHESNEYFTTKYIQVDGESKALKDVSENDMDNMSDSEYRMFETKFIQIYSFKRTSPK